MTRTEPAMQLAKHLSDYAQETQALMLWAASFTTPEAVMTTLPHHVTVTAQPDGDPIVTFECPWKYGRCHFYPDCQCESWDTEHYRDNGVGHHAEHHDECWLQAWFEAGCISYAGEDADDMTDTSIPRDMNRSGPIKVEFEYDYVAWWFA